MRYTFFFFIILTSMLLSCESKLPIDVLAKNGNIFLLYKDGQQKQLTYTTMDTSPVLSPDGRKVTFIRKTLGPEIETGSCCWDNNEIWLYDIYSNEGKAVVRSKEEYENMENALAGLANLQFSPDGVYIYFMSAAWATSNSIHRYNLTTKTESFISAGNTMKIIQSGKYKGFIIASKHKYWNGGGSYDYYWLMTKDGEEIREIGDSQNEVEQFLSDYNK